MKQLVAILFLLFATGVIAQDQSVKDLQSQAGRTIKKDAADTSKST
jgi:hypothetical protein